LIAEKLRDVDQLSTSNNLIEITTQEMVLPKTQLDNPTFFLNRELSWIRFNVRVLEEAQDPTHPLLERAKFLAIAGSNLDEFFMTRIPRLLKKVSKGSIDKSTDGMTAFEQIETTRREIIPLIEKHAKCWKEELLPALAKQQIYIKKNSDLTQNQKEKLRQYFTNIILPTFKTHKQDIAHAFVENLHVNLLVVTKNMRGQEVNYIVDVPTEQFGRLIEIPGNESNSQSRNEKITIELFFLEDLVASNLDLLYPNEEVIAAFPFRLTRNGEIDIVMDESSDFLLSVKKSVQNRKEGFASRLEFDKKMPKQLRELLSNLAGLPSYLLYDFAGPLGLVDLWQLLKIDRPELKDQPFLPCALPFLAPDKNIFKTIAKRDFVLYHPYDSFEVIIHLFREAAKDPKVLEICITLYRLDSKSPVVDALIQAAKRGKKVTAIIELKAKFDEENNINLVWTLKKAGVNVVYNFPNFKVHAKLCLIVRKEKAGVTRYSHIGSGNYNSVTAKIYGDIGYLTAKPGIGKELSELFNVLSEGLQEEEFNHLLVAPKTLKKEILRRIEREIFVHRKTGNGYLAFKLNNLEEKEVIQALYRASMAGVKIDLNVRGICCLRPGVKGVSDNISVVSIVGRFLEHARIYYFQNGGQDEILIGSSDLMFRNLNERIEVVFAVPDPEIRREIFENMLRIHLQDNVKSRRLLTDGSYERVKRRKNQEIINSQSWLLEHRGIWHEYQS
jgi:polyphosphate kinase